MRVQRPRFRVRIGQRLIKGFRWSDERTEPERLDSLPFDRVSMTTRSGEAIMGEPAFEWYSRESAEHVASWFAGAASVEQAP
jgi:hypothetical protein